jgi:hypothetical protein
MLIKKFKDLTRSLANRRKLFGSAAYWEQRYAAGGNSGHGSYGCLQEFKRCTLNVLIKKHSLSSAVELGCGDGAQLEGVQWSDYTGFDVSHHAVALCAERFHLDRSKRFLAYSEWYSHAADAGVSLDVIYHLVEDEVYREYMRRLFLSARRIVIIYSTDFDHQSPDVHVRHRRFTDYIATHQPMWRLLYTIPNPHKPASVDTSYTDKSAADFYVFGNRTHG